MKHRLQSGRPIQPTLESAGTARSRLRVHPPVVWTAAFETLQRRLTQERLQSVENRQHATQVKWAAEEASPLAWATGYPWLFFPLLFDEKSANALHRARRQDEIHERSRQLLGLRVRSVRSAVRSI